MTLEHTHLTAKCTTKIMFKILIIWIYHTFAVKLRLFLKCAKIIIHGSIRKLEFIMNSLQFPPLENLQKIKDRKIISQKMAYLFVHTQTPAWVSFLLFFLAEPCEQIVHCEDLPLAVSGGFSLSPQWGNKSLWAPANQILMSLFKAVWISNE